VVNQSNNVIDIKVTLEVLAFPHNCKQEAMPSLMFDKRNPEVKVDRVIQKMH